MMPLIFQRSLLTRLADGLVRDFKANNDVANYWKGRIFKGPFNGGDDSSLNAPQIIVMPVGGASNDETGVSGVQGNQTLAVLVGSYELVRSGPWPTGGSGFDEYDRLDLLKRVIRAGTELDNHGKIIDPDNASSNNAILKYLNTEIADFSDNKPRVVPNKGIALWSFFATFTTRTDNFTLLRA